MVKEKMLTASEKAEIVKLLALNKKNLHQKFSKKLKRDHRTKKNFVNDGKEGKKKLISGQPKVTAARDLRKIKCCLYANSQSTSKAIFDHTGIAEISKGLVIEY